MNKLRYSILILIALLSLVACEQNGKNNSETTETLFSLIDESESGLDFNTDGSYSNTKGYLLGSAGIAVVDFNNDDLPDVFFTRKEGNRLYQNLGNFKFKDITETANLVDKSTSSRKSQGIAIADVNGDGWADIYVTKRGMVWDSIEKVYTDYGRNLLYINNGDMTFTEKGKEYKLDIPGYSPCANFFDYDNDGDLDMYLVNWPNTMKYVFDFTHYKKLPTNPYFVDQLFENIDGKYFEDVGQKAGLMNQLGYGNSVTISDINNDGWQDIFVGNDFFGRDFLYLNNGDKTFSEVGLTYFDKNPFFSMGSDFADINNDGYTDLFIAEMMPEDHYRQKQNLLPYSIEVYEKLKQDHKVQYQRNMLHINKQGKGFSEVGFLADVNATEWSWNILFGDYDHDGMKDLFVTNGFKRDQVNTDFIKANYGEDALTGDVAWDPLHKDANIDDLPSFKISNYAYHNVDGVRFDKMNEKWGIIHPGHSHGAGQADLDNDGDLDFVIHNLDTVAYLYRNNAVEMFDELHWLKVSLKGNNLNTRGIGSRIYVYANGEVQLQEVYYGRGFRSGSEPIAHFGLGEASLIDSITVIWVGGKGQTLYDIKVDQTIVLDQNEALEDMKFPLMQDASKLLEEITEGLPTVEHKEAKFIDFKRDRLLHRQFSKEGPGIAVADVNGDGSDDFFVGGASGQYGSLVIQNEDGSFKKAPNGDMELAMEGEDMSTLFFDADNDGDMDLYIASGSNEFDTESIYQADRLYINDGSGGFTLQKDAPIGIETSTGVVVACDFDKDGDTDLFVGGRIVPGLYPTTPRSYLLQNEGGRFKDVTDNLAPGLGSIGMVTSALWSDYDNDGWRDLILVGEWMPVTVFKNNQGSLVGTEVAGLDASNGWWNSLLGADFDHDGDIDYMAGNLGWNTYFKASPEQPVSIYANDFDNSGTLDPVVFHYVTDVNIPFVNRDIFCEQMPSFNNQFYTFAAFANATADNIFEPQQVEEAQKLYAYNLASSYIENRGEEGFVISNLPIRAQFGPIYGMVDEDINGDGFLDVLVVGNSFSNHYEYGNYDALDGLVLLGNANGEFLPAEGTACGFEVPGDAKSLARVSNQHSGENIFLAANNNGALQYFKATGQRSKQIWKWQQQDDFARVTMKDGTKRKVERYQGGGYLSQQSSINPFDTEKVQEIVITDMQGAQRTVWPVSN